jgi:hypothetical protein
MPTVRQCTDRVPVRRCIDCTAAGPFPWPGSCLCCRCFHDLIAGLDRRREAALRLGPLGDGAADPITEGRAAA